MFRGLRNNCRVIAIKRKPKSVLWDKEPLAFSELATVVLLRLVSHSGAEGIDFFSLTSVATGTTQTISIVVSNWIKRREAASTVGYFSPVVAETSLFENLGTQIADE